MANKNTSLGAAKINKKNEFYTQLSDIEKELRHYRQHFKGKTVFCNCDDPYESNFFKYFVLNFNRLGLKKLISTSYATSPIAGTQFSYHIDRNGQMSFTFGGNKGNEPLKKAYKAVVNTVYDKTGNDAVEMLDVAELFESGENELTELSGDGDFRSPECLELLDQSDIVCTNPPFSLFREYINTLMDHEKKFVIIGNQNAIHYKEVFPLLKDNKLWLGYGFPGNVGFFESPYEDKAVSSQHKEGMIRISGVMWFTNMDIKKRHEDLILIKRYNPERYPKFENYDAIEVGKTADIPCDYSGAMGVPDTFIDKYNPDQFEIIGLGSGYLGQSIGVTGIPTEHKKMMKGHSAAGDLYYMEDGRPKVPYSRILIRNKHPEQPKGA